MGTYTFTASYSDSTEGVEFEPNDSLATAQLISLGESITGSLSSGYDYEVDYFAVEVSGSGSLTVTMTQTTDGNRSFSYSVLNSSGEVLDTSSCYYCNDEEMSVGVSASGTYYVGVISNYRVDAPVGTYTFTASYLVSNAADPAPLIEFEPNNDFATAQSIILDEEFIGSLSSGYESEADYFKVELPRPGIVRLKLTSALSNTSNVLIEYSLMNEQEIVLDSSSCSDCGGELVVDVDKGTFYVRIVSSDPFKAPNEPYAIKVLYEEPRNGLEREPNNTASSGQLLEAEQTYQGRLSSQLDQDWYRVTVSKAVDLFVSVRSEDVTNFYWKVRVLDSDEKVLVEESCSLETCDLGSTVLLVRLLAAGDYFIVIEPYSLDAFSNGVYEIEISMREVIEPPVVVENVTADKGTSELRIRVDWSDIQTGNEYEVYRREENEADFSLVGKTRKLRFLDYDVEPAINYFYKIIAFNEKGRSADSKSDFGYLFIPRDSVSDLEITSIGADWVEMTWTVPEKTDPDYATVQGFDVRYSKSLSVLSNWLGATKAPEILDVKIPGAKEKLRISGLSPESSYFIGLKVIENSGFASDVSNVQDFDTEPLLSTNPSIVQLINTSAKATTVKIELSNLSTSGSLSIVASVNGVGTKKVAGASTQSKHSSEEVSGKSAVFSKLPKKISFEVEGWTIQFLESATARSIREFTTHMQSLGPVLVKTYVSEKAQYWRISSELVGVDSKVIKFINSHKDVDYAEQNFPVKLNTTYSNETDPLYGVLWGLDNNGQERTSGRGDYRQGVSGADINVQEAWELSRGNERVVVAVFDTGIDPNHRDLVSNLWTNKNEIPGNGIDDDRNGYIDDLQGWDYCANDGSISDRSGHGTHVSGTIAATGGNGIGIVGVAPNVSIMTLKILPGDFFEGLFCQANDLEIARAIRYAADNGADVMNHSWGCRYPGTDKCSESRTLNRAFRYAEERDVVFVYAAGNDAMDSDKKRVNFWASDFDNGIAVAATDRSDTLADFSNTGRRSVHISAPGVAIASTWPGNRYKYLPGTSMASPHVAGAAALIRSMESSLTAAQVKELLLSTSDKRESLLSRTSSGGRLNIGRAVSDLYPEWIRLKDPGTIDLLAGSVQELEIEINGSGLEFGTHEGALVLNLEEKDGYEVIIPISLTLVNPRASAGVSGQVDIQPENLIVVSDEISSSIDISWDPVAEASGYTIFRSTTLENDFQVLAETRETVYSDVNAESDSIYFYRVVANFGNGYSLLSESTAGLRTDRASDLSVSLVAEVTDILLGDSISFDFELKNSGPNDVENVSVFALIPYSLVFDLEQNAGTDCEFLEGNLQCRIGELVTDQSKILKLSFSSLSEGEQFVQFRASSSYSDPADENSDNNSIARTFNVLPSFDLSFGDVKEVEDSLSLVVLNSGPSLSSSFRVGFEAGEGAGVSGAASTLGACMYEGLRGYCEFSGLEAGALVEISITLNSGSINPVEFKIVSEEDANQTNNQLTYQPQDLASDFSFDIDESLEAQPLTDGLLVIRHLFGFSGDSLTSGAVSGKANRQSSDEIAAYLTDADTQLDIDGDGSSQPLTDGLLLIRYLFGFSGDSLVAGALGSDATRDTPEAISAYISERVPTN